MPLYSLCTMFKWLKELLMNPEFGRKKEFLQRIPLFRGVTRREFGILFQALVVRQYNSGEILCGEGDIGRALFLIESGSVEVFRKGADGHSTCVAILKSGDFFGELSLVDEQPRTATVVALEPVRACLLYKSEIDKLLRKAPHIGAAVMTHLSRLLAARLRSTLDPTGFSTMPIGHPEATISEVL